jgi:Phytanoyl-CoA dioxygenase (PhyH)
MQDVDNGAGVQPVLSRSTLTSSEVAQYHEKGYLVPKYHLSEDDLALLRKQVEAVVSDNSHLRNRLIPAAHIPSKAIGTRGVNSSGELLKFATHPDFVDLIECIEGPDLINWTTTIFHKPAIEGNATPWHRDAYFWPIEPLATSSVWVAVTDCLIENGCFRVIPGSHLTNNLGRHYDAPGEDLIFGGSLAPEEYDESDAVDVELHAGEVCLFEARLIHGARPNRSKMERIGFTSRFMPATSWFDHNKPAPAGNERLHAETGFSFADQPLFLVRGEDRTGRNKLRPFDQ